jgi:hypothetical protein
MVTTGNFTSFLASDDTLWDQANRIRAANSLKSLRRE